MAGARKAALSLQDIFGDRLYLELQENGLDEQKIANKGLMELSRELGIPLVATNDCHYLNRTDAHAHEVLLCIQTGKTIHDKSRFRFSTDELYFKSPEEMKKAFAYCPEAIANTVAVAERCNLELDFCDHHFPDLSGAGRRDPGLDLREGRQDRPRRSASTRSANAGNLTPELSKTYREPAGHGDRRHQDHGLSRLFPDRRRFHQLGQIPEDPGGSGPRLRRRQSGRLLHADHRYRPHSLRPDLREVSQHRTQKHARLRRRFLPGAARRGDRVRPGKIRRRRPCGPDHHLRFDEGQGGDPRCRPGPGHGLRRCRPDRQADPRRPEGHHQKGHGGGTAPARRPEARSPGGRNC